MDKREFLKASSLALTGTMLTPFVAGQSSIAADSAERPAATRKNWSGNYTYSTDRLDTPASVEEVQAIVKRTRKLRALGTRHSFNAIADSTSEQISLQHFDQMTIDPAARTVTIGAGVTYGKLAPYIDSHGFALHNLASLPHISAAGACATATHGSGIHNQNLSCACAALELVTANGERLTLSRTKDADHFAGAIVALGALGIVTSLTLDLEPTYQVEQVVYQDLRFSELEHNLDAIFGSGYSVSLFTDWQNQRATQVWIKRRVEPGKPYTWPQEFYNAKRAKEKLHPITGHPAEACTEQLGVPGPWYERLPHFRMNFTPSSGAELQTEYFVPREHAYEAIRAVEQLRDHITPHLFVTELRTIAPDSLWMSMAYQRPSLAIHFTWKPEWPAVKKILPMIEAKLAPFEPRPHWAKLFTLPPATLQSRYARLRD
ncbi:MAG TPA: FAD-binding protein, partial [Acidobacteriaceae bacterium]